LVRHFFNTRHNSHKYAWALPVGALGMICLAYVTGPAQMPRGPDVAEKIQYQPLPGTAIGGHRADEPKPDVASAPAPASAPVPAPATAPVTAPTRAPAEAVAAQPAQASTGGVDFEKVHSVIQERCTVCHSAKPTSPLFSSAPAGIMFDTPQQIQQLAPRIQAQAVTAQIMPLGNITQMTQQERDLLGQWIDKGAQTN
jgi:uncharacterized membrane protein